MKIFFLLNILSDPQNLKIYLSLGILGIIIIWGFTLLLRNLKHEEEKTVNEATNRLQKYIQEEPLTEGYINNSQVSPVEQVRNLLEHFFGEQVAKNHRFSHIPQDLASADLKLRPIEWIIIVFGFAIVFGLLLTWKFQNSLFLPIGILVGYFIPGFYLRRKKNQRSKKFEKEFSKMLRSLSGAIKSGQTLIQSLKYVSEDAEEPLLTEFIRVNKEIDLGIPINEALGHLYERNSSEDVFLFNSAIEVYQSAGGDLAKILDTIESTLRERNSIRGDIVALMTQAKVSGYVLMCLPPGLALVLNTISPKYFDQIFTSIVGIVILGLAATSEFIGFLLMRKVINFKV